MEWEAIWTCRQKKGLSQSSDGLNFLLHFFDNLTTARTRRILGFFINNFWRRSFWSK